MRLIFVIPLLIAGCAPKLATPVEQIPSLKKLDDVMANQAATADPLFKKIGQSAYSDAEFAAMKPTAVILNVGRGPVIDEAAMVRALTAGRIKGAGLDVFENEPLAAGHPLYGLENVLLSPHCADHTPDWLDQAMRFFIEQFERFRTGVPLKNVVDKKLGY